MRNVLILASAAAFFATVASADTTNVPASGPTVSGNIEVEVNKDGDTTLTLGAGLSAGSVAFGNFSVESVDGGSFALDEWQIGTDIANAATLSFGDQGSIFIEGSDFTTLADPAIDESLRISMGDAQIALGFSDFDHDITDIGSLQGSYTMALSSFSVRAAGDYNLDSEEYVVGGRIGGFDLAGLSVGSALSYASVDSKIAYEIDGSMLGVTAYVNGDDSNALQNIGAGYGREISGINLGTDVNYNIDTEEFTPSVTIGFTF